MTRTVHLLGKMMGLTSAMMLVFTPLIHVFAPIPDIRYVVGGQLATFALAVALHGGVDPIIDAYYWDREDANTGVPDDPETLIGDGDE